MPTTTVTKYYSVNGQIIGEKVGSNPRTDYLTDALGSVTATVDQTCHIINEYRYKPYGAQLAKTGSGSDSAFRWVGSLGYRQTGLNQSDVYVRARHYGAGVGRWTSLDPVAVREMYSYVRGATTRAVDPTGLLPPTTIIWLPVPHPGTGVVVVVPVETDCCALTQTQPPGSACQGTWQRCVGLSSAGEGAKCDAFLDSDQFRSSPGLYCSLIGGWLAQAARDCVYGTSGGGGSAGMFTQCCKQPLTGLNAFCGFWCCRGSPSDPRNGEGISACRAKCLLQHEEGHVRECNRGVNIRESGNEHCAYHVQTDCLANIYEAHCGDPLSIPFVAECDRLYAAPCDGW
jgi:RHS repeat-associated protein